MRLISPLIGAATTVLLCVGCGESSSSEAAASGGSAGQSSGGAGGAAGSSGGSAGGGGTGGTAKQYPPGPPGCGLDAAAFCDTFDAPAAKDPSEGRSGELDPALWSGARLIPGLNWGPEAIAVGLASVQNCRGDVPAKVYPDQDVLVCDGNDAIQSRHLLVAAAEQNYGQASLRIRRPFDFQGREGKVVFDAEAEHLGPLHGWVSIAITEDPSPAPSFGIQQNFENGPIPRRGVELHLATSCQQDNKVGVLNANVFDDWVERYYQPASPLCVTTQKGHLNHFELRVSKSHIELWGSDASPDGTSFGNLQKLYELDVDLKFERGYVHLNTHNHATLKYSMDAIDAWVVRYDNVGFDGPQIPSFREYSVPNSLTAVTVDGVDARNVGYLLDPAAPADLTFKGVDLTGAQRARIALNTRYLMGQGDPYAGYTLRYRLNGGAWHDQKFTPGQLNLVEGPLVYDESGTSVREGTGISGAMSQLLDVDLAELEPGDNKIEFTTEGIPTSYRPWVANVDLIVETN